MSRVTRRPLVSSATEQVPVRCRNNYVNRADSLNELKHLVRITEMFDHITCNHQICLWNLNRTKVRYSPLFARIPSPQNSAGLLDVKSDRHTITKVLYQFMARAAPDVNNRAKPVLIRGLFCKAINLILPVVRAGGVVKVFRLAAMLVAILNEIVFAATNKIQPTIRRK